MEDTRPILIWRYLAFTSFLGSHPIKLGGPPVRSPRAALAHLWWYRTPPGAHLGPFRPGFEEHKTPVSLGSGLWLLCLYISREAGRIGHHEIKTFNISLMRFMAEVSHHTLSDGGFLRMSNESSALLLDLPLGRFAQISDDQNDGIIECYCAFCYRLITASRDRHVLDMARQKHICAKASQAAMELIA